MSTTIEPPTTGEAPHAGSVPGVAAPARSSVAEVMRAYVALTKPRIIELLLITAVPAMMLAAGGLPSLWTILVVVVGGTLAAGSANALNCYLDRDIDQLMGRTSRRPLPRHVVSAPAALVFGVVSSVVSVGLLAVFTNLLAAALTLGAVGYYVFVYTLLLKRRTVHNTVLGGVCGAAPVLIGWAAVTGTLAWPAWLLFAVVFLWQPPHFWALALKFKDDYADAGVPMLPAVAPARRVLAESVVYTWLTVAVSVAVWPLATSPLYGVAAVLLGALLLVEVHRLHQRVRHGGKLSPMRLFHSSNTYLTFLFVVLAVDALVG